MSHEETGSPEVRLHPLSILFGLGGEIRNLAIPVIAALFATRQTERPVVMQLFVVLVVALIAATWRFFSFRLRFDAEELVIRSGVFRRNERHVPYNRVQNIDTRRNAFHQLFGVAEVVIQTAGGDEPEAKLSVLHKSAIDVIRGRVFQRGRQSPDATTQGLAAVESAVPQAADVNQKGEVLLRLNTADLLSYGFIENRGMFAVIAVAGLLFEFDPLSSWLEEVVGEEIEGGGPVRGFLSGAFSSGGVPPELLATGAVLLLALLVTVRVLSVIWAAIRLHNFTVLRAGDDLRVEYGLFTRVAGTVPMKRIQTVVIRETLSHRLFRCATVDVTTAGSATSDPKGIDEPLVPVIPVTRVESFVRQLWPALELSSADWRPLHPRAHLRIFRSALLGSAIVSFLFWLLVRWWALVYLGVMLIWHLYSARKKARLRHWTVHQNFFAVRGGWLRRSSIIAWLNKVQVVELRESWFDRRTGMAEIRANTGGAAAGVNYITAESARQTLTELSLAAAGGRTITSVT